MLNPINALFVGDLDGDGDSDMLVSSGGLHSNGFRITWFENLGGGAGFRLRAGITGRGYFGATAYNSSSTLAGNFFNRKVGPGLLGISIIDENLDSFFQV